MNELKGYQESNHSIGAYEYKVRCLIDEGLSAIQLQELALQLARELDAWAKEMLDLKLGIVPPMFIVTSDEERQRIMDEFESAKGEKHE